MNFIGKNWKKTQGRPECVSWSMQGCEGAMGFLGFYLAFLHACADGLQARKEGKELWLPYQSC